MRSNEKHQLIRVKNGLLSRQARIIKLLAKKTAELQKKYSQVKYADIINHLKSLA